MAGMYTLSAGEGEATWFLQNRMVLKATAETTGGAYGLVESTIAPGASPPLRIHRREDEAFYVLEGDRPARVLTLMSPGGGERFFVEGGREPETDGLPRARTLPPSRHRWMGRPSAARRGAGMPQTPTLFVALNTWIERRIFSPHACARSSSPSTSGPSPLVTM